VNNNDTTTKRQTTTKRRQNIFNRSSGQRSTGHIYVNSQTGKDSNNGSSESSAVKTLSKALTLVKNYQRPLTGNLIVHLSGTFERQRLNLTGVHAGTSASKRVIFRGDSGSTATTRLLGGNALDFVKVSTLASNHPARELASYAGVGISNLYAAAPPSNFPSSDSTLKWRDGDCRDDENYASPPLLSVDRRVMTRAREPNLPARTAPVDENSMGETRDAWLRTNAGNQAGKVFYKSSDASSITKASASSWNNAVNIHIFPLVDWYDARLNVGARNVGSNNFECDTTQNAPGNPDGGSKFRIVNQARYYLEGAIEYLDTAGEYHVSLGEVVSESRGWTLYYPEDGVDLSSAVLSITKNSLIEINTSEKKMHVSFENLVLEGSRRYLLAVYNSYYIDFYKCSFINAGHDAADVWSHHVTFRSCIFEGSGGSALRSSDDRDSDTDGKGFALLESGNAVVDSLISDFANTCRHYSEGLALGGYGNIISNNHFRSSNMAAIDIALGMARMIHNVFSHISDGSYDDGAIHWVIESPMERGNEVAYNVFFRNGVSEEPCNAETSCYQADIYMDDMAGGMIIHGNVMIKDKVIQSVPPNNNFAVINWLGILINGGADVTVYENAFVGPEDGSTTGVIYKNKASLFTQTCGGTIWPDDETCGNTGVCAGDVFYKTMRQYDYLNEPWASQYPELSIYDASPSSGSNYYCANTRSCPMAAWNNTVICNAGSGGALTNRAIWPSDSASSQSDEAVETVNVPKRNIALTEYGNKVGQSYTLNIDSIETSGMASVLQFAKQVSENAEASSPSCDEGLRSGATRSDLTGRFNNPCTDTWASDGMDSCDPCSSSKCAPRDLVNDQCSCSNDTPFPPTSPTPATVEPTPTGSTSSCSDSPVRFKIIKNDGKKITRDCVWVANNSNNRCNFNGVSAICPSTCDTCGTCDDATLRFKITKNGKKITRDCTWVSTKNTVGRCALSGVSQTCRQTCNSCNGDEPSPVPPPSPTTSASYDIYTEEGYCIADEEEEVNNISDAESCWLNCKSQFDFDYAEYTDSVCYCQSDCSCMDASGQNNINAIVPSGFVLPNDC